MSEEKYERHYSEAYTRELEFLNPLVPAPLTYTISVRTDLGSVIELSGEPGGVHIRLTRWGCLPLERVTTLTNDTEKGTASLVFGLTRTAATALRQALDEYLNLQVG